ncbi:MAG: endo-1,4-beta-xylanase [Acidobacteria bacterium]|nr:endo-1,4-beta-xylanase [Acidobacteriota bacterium]MBI3423095.1 endo-1,4-beta-xylanase [Acidobacteriota bacterium]
MKTFALLMTLSLTFAVRMPANAQTPVSLLPDNLYNASGELAPRAIAAPISVNGQAFTQAYRLTINSTSAKLSDAALQWATVRAVNTGDNLTLTFWVRKVAPLDGHNLRGLVLFGKADEKPALAAPFPCDSDVWMRYSIPFKAAADYASGAAQLTFQFAHGPQAFELGGLALTDSGPTPTLGNVPTTAVIPENYTQGSSSYFDSSVGGGSSRVASATGQNFTQAFQITVNGNSAFVYNAGLGWRTITQVNKNDVLLLTFWLRKVEGAGPVKGQVIFERASSPNEKSVRLNYPTESTEWKLYQMPFKAADNYTPGQAQVAFQFAYGPQKFEVGGVSVVNYGPNVLPEQLPKNYDYAGRGDANAAWRTAAQVRINQIRKADLTVVVRDREGKPLPGATVFVQQTDHAYRFGSAVTAARITGTGADNEQYRAHISSHFTTSVLENDLKWPIWECTTCGASFNKDNTRRAITWLLERNIAVRGHNLIWPSTRNMPTNTAGLTGETLRKRIDDHFAEILSDAGTNGKLYQWDVVNEPYDNFDVQGRIPGVAGVAPSNGALGNEEIVRWYQNARRLDPAAKLTLNDYDILAGGGLNTLKQNFLFALVAWLRERGAPVEVIGFQGHFGYVTPIDTMQAIVDRFAQLGLPIAITEFDFDTTDEALQADFTRDFMTFIFSQPSFDDFLMWGFWERAHWLPAGAMYRADWSSKPNALAYTNLLFNEWWTNADGLSDAAGKFTARGFKGEYNVTVRVDRVEKIVTAKLDGNGEVVVDLDVLAPRGPMKRTVPEGRGVTPSQ